MTSKPNNVINIESRRRNQRHEDDEITQIESAPVVDMTERRNEMITQERRLVRRTILSEFIGAFLVVPDRGLQKVTMHDISDNGIAFDIDFEAGQLKIGEEVAMRVYLSNQTYFPFIIKIANARSIPAEGISRHGGNFVRGTVNDVALHHFVRFFETVSASLQTDHGDILVSGLHR